MMTKLWWSKRCKSDESSPAMKLCRLEIPILLTFTLTSDYRQPLTEAKTSFDFTTSTSCSNAGSGLFDSGWIDKGN